MEVSDLFVDQLFANRHFNTLLSQFNLQKVQEKSHEPKQSSQTEIQISKVIEEINAALFQTCKQAISTQCNHLYESNTYILNEIQTIKAKLSTIDPQEISLMHAAQKNPLSTSIFFDPDLDLKQMRQNINSLQSEIEQNHKSLIHSFQMYEERDENAKENLQLQFDIEFKLNQKLLEETKKIQNIIQQKIKNFEINIQHRVEQLKKTITKVVEAMNDPSFWVNQNNFDPQIHESPKAEDKQQKIVFTKVNQRIFAKEVQDPQNQESPKKMDITLPSSPSDRKPDLISGSNKTMESLNKSFNFGKTKIKSLFGFKTTTKLVRSPLKIIQ